MELKIKNKGRVRRPGNHDTNGLCGSNNAPGVRRSARLPSLPETERQRGGRREPMVHPNPRALGASHQIQRGIQRVFDLPHLLGHRRHYCERRLRFKRLGLVFLRR